MRELEDKARQYYVPPYHVALVYYGLRDEAGSLRQIERMIEGRAGTRSWFGIDPYVRWLASHPRFQELVRPLGLPA
ncbi:MAG TPA: hypothetical protein VHR41_17375 [Gemmatimonadales bacterium]|nr:hypothetical protein [Gemmatimonadales bacterium]